jgi:hypothetical protein
MKKKVPPLILPFILLLTALLAAPSFGASAKAVTVTVPVAVIKTAFDRLLPLELTPIKQLSGKLWLKSVRQLKIGDNQASFLTAIHGKQIGLNMGSLIVDIGTVNLSFHSLVELRFDKAKRVLYIKPHVTQKNIQANKKNVGSDLTQLLSVFNEVEYPIAMKTLRPIVANTSSGKIFVNMVISNIYTRKGMLYLELIPHFDKGRKKSKTGKKNQ